MTPTAEDDEEVVCETCKEPEFCSCEVCEVCGETIPTDECPTYCECGTTACDRCITSVTTGNSGMYICTPCADGDDPWWESANERPVPAQCR